MKIYRVLKIHGHSKGTFWQESRREVIHVGHDKGPAMMAYLRAEPGSGVGTPGTSGYSLQFETAEADNADHPDRL